MAEVLPQRGQTRAERTENRSKSAPKGEIVSRKRQLKEIKKISASKSKISDKKEKTSKHSQSTKAASGLEFDYSENIAMKSLSLHFENLKTFVTPKVATKLINIRKQLTNKEVNLLKLKDMDSIEPVNQPITLSKTCSMR